VPVQGFKSITGRLRTDFFERIILPTCTLSFIYVALIARMDPARAMLDVLGEDYGGAPRAPRGINGGRGSAAPCPLRTTPP